jgi:hypothetical protein
LAGDLVEAAAPLVRRRFAAVAEERDVKAGPLEAGRRIVAALKEPLGGRWRRRSRDHDQIHQFC